MPRSLSTLTAIAGFFLAAGLGLSQVQGSERPMIQDQKSDAPAAAPQDEETAERIRAIKKELRAIDEKRRTLSRELRTLQAQQRRERMQDLRRRAPNPRDLWSDLSDMRFDLGDPNGRGRLQLDLGDLFSGGGLKFGMDGGAGQSFSMQTDGDGRVVVEMTVKDEDGKPSTKRYEAESMEELLEKHPELKEKLSLKNLSFPGFSLDNFEGFGSDMKELEDSLEDFRRRFGAFRNRPGVRPTPPSLPRRLAPRGGDRLGVTVAPVDEETQLELELMDDQQGLVVKDVESKSLASRLGLKTGDVLLEINGKAVKGVESIGKALRAAQPHDEIEVRIFRAEKGHRTLRAAKVPAKKSRRV